MREAVLETLDICVAAYWIIYFCWLLVCVLTRGMDWRSLHIRQSDEYNLRLRKGFFAGFLLSADLFILYRLPSAAILALGKNSNISPYVFFAIILLMAELLLVVYITKNIDFSEFSFGGVKLTKKDDRIMINYHERQELKNARLKSKLLSSSLVFHDIQEKVNYMCQAISDSQDIVGEYIKQFEDLMYYYISEQKDREPELDIKLFCRNADLLDAICRHYQLSGFKAVEGIERLDSQDYFIIEEDQRTLIFIKLESQFAGEYIIIESTTETEVILLEEIYIISSIFSAFDQFIYEQLLNGES